MWPEIEPRTVGRFQKMSRAGALLTPVLARAEDDNACAREGLEEHGRYEVPMRSPPAAIFNTGRSCLSRFRARLRSLKRRRHARVG